MLLLYLDAHTHTHTSMHIYKLIWRSIHTFYGIIKIKLIAHLAMHEYWTDQSTDWPTYSDSGTCVRLTGYLHQFCLPSCPSMDMMTMQMPTAFDDANDGDDDNNFVCSFIPIMSMCGHNY